MLRMGFVCAMDVCRDMRVFVSYEFVIEGYDTYSNYSFKFKCDSSLHARRLYDTRTHVRINTRA